MSKYSFEDDLLFLLLQKDFFYVIPEDKDKTLMADLPLYFAFEQTTVHLINNSSEVWLISGIKVQ